MKSSSDLSFLSHQSIHLSPVYKPNINQPSLNQQANLSMFTLQQCIGVGGFSQVYLARHNSSQKMYALKVLDKHFIRQKDKLDIIMNERDIMINIKHPCIVKLEFAFQTQTYLIFVLEYCPGGDLFTHLK